MATLNSALGRRRDLPQLEGINLNAQAAAGAGADYEHVVSIVPQLSAAAGTGFAGELPVNNMSIRLISLIFEANLTGANTNNVTYNFNQRRGGNLLVNTTSSTAVAAAGVVTITPASITNFAPGLRINVSGGTGTAETITVATVNAAAGTFTAAFANTHSGTYNLVAAPLATITYASGTNATAFAPVNLVPFNNVLQPGDVVTIQRVSNGTGLITPALTIVLDWIPAGTQR